MKLIHLFLFLLPISLFAQFTDDFSDGNFSANPTWSGDAANFEVDVNGELHLIAPAATDISVLSTPSVAVDTSEWEFTVRMEFNPSSSNRTRVYLMSSEADLTGPLDGYFVQLGNSEDEISLFKQTGTSTTKIIDGADDLLDTDTANAMVRVTRSTTGAWELLTDTSLTASFTSQGTVTDTTHEASTWFGVYCDYTSTRSDKFYFDDFSVSGNAYLDNEAPEILSVAAISADQLEVVFNEALDPASAETSANYTVNNGIGAALNAAQDVIDPSKILLTFPNSFAAGQLLTLTVSNVEDLAGNAIGSADASFTYYNFEAPVLRDVVINEIMADQSPAVALPEEEFIELFNASAKTINLSGFTFSDPSSTGVFDESIVSLSPGEYLIVCQEDDTALFSPFGRVYGLSTFPSMNNSGDELTLADSSGLIIDAVRYTDSWYQDSEKSTGGFTLEQINPGNPCTGKDNWKASVSFDGGTPGSQNSVFNASADTTAPVIASAELTGPKTLALSFSKTMSSAALSSAPYAFSDGLSLDSVVLASADFTELTLYFTSNVDSALLYTLTINGLADCQGNALVENETSFGLGVSPQPFELLITELYPDPDEESSLPLAEFVEIVNASDKLLRLENIRIADRGDASTLATAVLLPGEYAIVCDDGFEEEFELLGKVITVGTMPSLNNANDEVSILRGSVVLDAVPYDDAWYRDADKDGGGWTLERIDALELCGLAGNWRASNASEGGTPGKENSVSNLGSIASDPALTGVQIVSLTEVILSVDKRIDSAAIVASTITIASSSASKSLNEDLFSITAEFDDPLERGFEYEISIEGLQDCAGRSLSVNTLNFYLPVKGDLALNEVLFNPRESGTDFVELYNTSAYEINLQGWSLAYYDSDDSLVFNLASASVLNLAPGEYICLNEDSADLKMNYPAAASDRFQTMNLPSYANDEGTVLLYDPLRENMAQFDYSEDFHFALISDADGVSLERIDASRDENASDNWISASSTENYATPGYVNSQTSSLIASSETVTLSSEIFSPDNDGYQDVLSIQYATSQPGWSCNIAVYDTKGYLIRQLVSNETIGAKGVFTWDGITDRDERARTGIHIISVEMFDLEGEKAVFRLPCVVASRL